MKVIIFAAGVGTKMWPYNFRNKCSIKIANKPIIEYILDALVKYEVKNIDIVVPKGEKYLYFLNSKYKVNLVQTKEMSVLDTLLSLYVEKNLDNTLLIYGDIIVHPSDIKKMIDNASKNENAVLGNKFDKEPANLHFGLSTNKNYVSKIYGHPRNHYVDLKQTGIFSINNSIKDFWNNSKGYLSDVPVGAMPPNENFLEIAIQLAIDNGQKYKLEICENKAFDFDRPVNIMDANNYITSEKCSYNKSQVKLGKGSTISDNVRVNGNIIIGENSHIKNGVILDENVIIGNNVIIENYAYIRSNTTISDYCHIGHLSDIQGVLMERVKSAHHVEVYGVVGESTDLAAGVTTGSMRFDDGFSKMDIKGKKTISSEYSNCVFIGNNVRTGVSNITYPGVIIGNFTAIGPGIVVSKNVSDKKVLTLKQNIVINDWDEKKYGW